jgi:hypothetical protein
MKILFWGLAVVIAVATGLYVDVPFLNFLKPGYDIALVQLHSSGKVRIPAIPDTGSGLTGHQLSLAFL